MEESSKPNTAQNAPEQMEIRRISGIIIQDGKILMLKGKGSQEFSTPGGGVEEGENDEACLRRELKEEIGVDLTASRFVTEYSASSFHNPKVILNVKVCLATISGIIKPDREIESFVWMSKEDFNSNRYPIVTSIKEKAIPYLIDAGIW